MSKTFGGLVFCPAASLTPPTGQIGAAAGNLALTRNALGDYSWNNVAGIATTNVIADFSVLTRPYINFPAFPGQGTVLTSNEFQEVFGNASGTAGNPFSGLASGATGLPSTQFGTPALPWGFAVIDVFVVYSVQTANLTAATIALNRNIFVENTATTNTAVLAATAVSLVTTTSATTPHVQKVTLAQPIVYEASDMSGLIIEFAMTTAGTSAVRIYGMGAHVAVEYS